MVKNLDDLVKIIDESENSRIELKRELTDDVLKGLSTDIAALANYDGGYIVFGVNDEKEPEGCIIQDKDRERISQEAANCHPPITVDFQSMNFGSKEFIIVKVARSPVLHSDSKRRFPIRVGNTTNYLDISGIMLHMRERGLIRGETTQPTEMQTETRRTPIPDLESSLVVKGLESENSAFRVETLKDLSRLVYSYFLFENKRIAELVEHVFNSGAEEEVSAVLEALRWTALKGTPSELETMSPWMKRIVEIGKTTDSSDIARRAYTVLESAGHSGAADLLVYWVSETDDERYSQIQPENLLQHAKHYSVDDKIREAMYKLLESGPGGDTEERISGLLSALRKAY